LQPSDIKVIPQQEGLPQPRKPRKRRQPRQKYWVSFAPDEKLTISDKAWQCIEGAFGVPMPTTLRKAVFKATQLYLTQVRFERAAVPIAEIVSKIDAFKKWGAAFLGLLPARRDTSDANSYAKSLIKKYWGDDSPLDDPEPDGEPDPFEELYDRVEELRDRVTPLLPACDAALTELKSDKDDDAFKDEAWDEWLDSITEIAEAHGLRTGAGKDDMPHPFVTLVRTLQKCLPAKYQRSTVSDAATAMAIGRSRSRGSR
jgi:hypothetical protein